jgi:hypothetical protein
MAGVNLADDIADSISDSFKQWRNVLAVLEQAIPPEMMRLAAEEERRKAIS